MPTLVIDKAKCTGDGVCVRVCSRGLLRVSSGAAEMKPEKASRCTGCGQCLAFCPEDAIRIEGLAESETPRLDPALAVSPEQARQLLLGRRSCRVFRKQPVPRELIETLLLTARQAPTGGNEQDVRWIVVEDPAYVQRIAEGIAEWFDETGRHIPAVAKRYAVDAILARFRGGSDVILRSSPHLIIAAAPEAAAWGCVHASIAMTYFELAAWAYGVGTCWSGYLMRALMTSPKLRALCGIEEGYAGYAAMMFGFAALAPRRVTPRRPLCVTWLGGR